jgi:hypothetical protein
LNIYHLSLQSALKQNVQIPIAQYELIIKFDPFVQVVVAKDVNITSLSLTAAFSAMATFVLLSITCLLHFK